MPYTQSTKERPRKDQIACPKDEGEFTLAITDECLKYLAKWGEKFKLHSQIVSALRGMPTYSVVGYMKQPSSIKHLMNNMAYYAKLSKLSEEALRGCYECALQEWYRKMVALYENQKCIENGDVYPIRPEINDLQLRIQMLEEQVKILLTAVKSDIMHIKVKKEDK